MKSRQATHLPKKWISPKKGKRKIKKAMFNILEVFFFLFFFKVFFPGEVYASLTQSFSEGAKKKHSKKNTIFTHSFYFYRKILKNELFPGKKNAIPLER